MRPMSKAAKAEAFDAIRDERDLYRTVAWYLLCGDQPDHVEKRVIVADAATYEFRLYNCDRADGGLLVRLYHTTGRPQVDVYQYEKWLKHVDELICLGGLSDVPVMAMRDAAQCFRTAARKLQQCGAEGDRNA